MREGRSHSLHWGPPTSEVKVLPLVEAQYKPVVLYLLFWLEETIKSRSRNREIEEKWQDYPFRITSLFLQQKFGLKIRPVSLERYYNEAKANAGRGNIPWGAFAVAQIISSQAETINTFPWATTFLKDYTDSDLLPPNIQQLVKSAWLMAGSDNEPLEANNSVKKFWKSIISRRVQPVDIPDPILRVDEEQTFPPAVVDQLVAGADDFLESAILD